MINGWAGLGRELEWFARLLALALGREERNNGSVFLTQSALMEACDVLEPDLQLQMLRNLSMPELIQVVFLFCRFLCCLCHDTPQNSAMPCILCDLQNVACIFARCSNPNSESISQFQIFITLL